MPTIQYKKLSCFLSDDYYKKFLEYLEKEKVQNVLPDFERLTEYVERFNADYSDTFMINHESFGCKESDIMYYKLLLLGLLTGVNIKDNRIYLNKIDAFNIQYLQKEPPEGICVSLDIYRRLSSISIRGEYSAIVYAQTNVNFDKLCQIPTMKKFEIKQTSCVGKYNFKECCQGSIVEEVVYDGDMQLPKSVEEIIMALLLPIKVTIYRNKTFKIGLVA